MKKKNLKEMIDCIVADVVTWDRASLVYEAQARVRESLEAMKIAELFAYCKTQFPEG